jgi:hypothetical protein
MTENFPDREYDPETPTEQDLDQCYGSKYLAVTDVGKDKRRVKILKVRKEILKSNDGKERAKIILFFSGFDKPMVINATNKNVLVDGLGKDPGKWIGASVGVFVAPTTFAGKPTKGLRLRVLEHFQVQAQSQPTQSAPKPKPAPATRPAPKPSLAPAAAAEPWPVEPDDPGYDPNFKPDDRLDAAE